MRKGIAWGAVATVVGGAALLVPATAAHAVMPPPNLKLCMSDTDGNGIKGQVTADGNDYLTDNANNGNNFCATFTGVPTGLYQVRSDAKQPDEVPRCGAPWGPACAHVYEFDHLQINRGAGNPETYSDPTVITRLGNGDNVKVTFFWK